MRPVALNLIFLGTVVLGLLMFLATARTVQRCPRRSRCWTPGCPPPVRPVPLDAQQGPVRRAATGRSRMPPGQPDQLIQDPGLRFPRCAPIRGGFLLRHSLPLAIVSSIKTGKAGNRRQQPLRFNTPGCHTRAVSARMHPRALEHWPAGRLQLRASQAFGQRVPGPRPVVSVAVPPRPVVAADAAAPREGGTLVPS